MKKIALVICICLLSACATMTPEECKTSNWRDKGFSDAIKGKAVQLDSHAKACTKINIQPDRTTYMSGYNEGAKQFCTYQSGLNFGKKGKHISTICSAPSLGQDFFKGYDKGKKIYDINKQIKNKVTERKKIEKEIRNIHKQKEKSSAKNLDLLYREKELVNREINVLKRELSAI